MAKIIFDKSKILIRSLIIIMIKKVTIFISVLSQNNSCSLDNFSVTDNKSKDYYLNSLIICILHLLSGPILKKLD